MQEAYLGGIEQITNGTIKKQLDRVKQATGGWKDGDIEDTDPKPGIQPRWHKTLSLALKEMRQSGEISNDSVKLADLHPGCSFDPCAAVLGKSPSNSLVQLGSG